MIVSGGTSVFSATHIPFAKSITVHDIRSVIEYYMRQGTQQFKLLDSRQIRTARLVCVFSVRVFSVNDMEVFL